MPAFLSLAVRNLTNISVWLSTILWAVTGWAASADCEQVDCRDGPAGVELVGPSEAAQQTRHPSGGEVRRQPDGDRYEGEWLDGRPNGRGIMHYSDGRRHEGQWQDGEKNGLGTFYGKRGRIERQGRWKDDRLIQRMRSLPDVEG